MSTQPGQTEKQERRWRSLALALTALLVVVLLGSVLGAFFLFFPTLLASPTTVDGTAFYTSSGQLVPGTARGIADQLQIDLRNVPAPQAGNSYFVWLLIDRHPETVPDLTGARPIHPPLLLTRNLPVHNGTVHYLYQGDSAHNNLLSTASRLLITEENSTSQTSTPTRDRNAWRYYGEIPQAQIPGADPGFSALVHIRHLFYNETNIKVLGLPGGLDNWMFRNSEKVLEWSVSARDYWNGPNTTPNDLALMNDQFIRILDYLDGSANVHVDLPSSMPIVTDPTITQVALLTVDAKQGGPNLATNPPGYVDHVQLHVGQVAKAPDISPDMRQRTARILDAVNNAKNWLTNVHKYAVQLAAMRDDPNALMQPSTRTLLDEMVTQATYAYIGQLNPVTNRVVPGILQAHYEIQKLATFTITTDIPQQV